MGARARRSWDRRRAELAKIHIGRKQLDLDEESYRGLLERVTGQRSSADLDASGRGRVIEEMHRLGCEFRGRRRRRKRIRVSSDRRGLLGKIYAELGDRPVNYARAILRRQCGEGAPDRLEWATPEQLRKVVAALAIDRRRRARRAR